MASPGFSVRGHDDRGAEGASIEAPRRRVGGIWGGVSVPQPTGGSGERRELPQRGIAFSAYFRPQNASGGVILLEKLHANSTLKKWW